MRIIAVTELKQNLGKYLELALKEKIYVKKHGKIITLLTSPNFREIDRSSFLSLGGKYQDFDYERCLDQREYNR